MVSKATSGLEVTRLGGGGGGGDDIHGTCGYNPLSLLVNLSHDSVAFDACCVLPEDGLWLVLRLCL